MIGHGNPELFEICKVIEKHIVSCDCCDGTGQQNNDDACHKCGGYGEVLEGDIMEAILTMREIINTMDKGE